MQSGRYGKDALDASLDFDIATAISPGGGGSSAQNASMLRANAEAFKTFFEEFDAGTMTLGQFRGQMKKMGIIDTSESTKMLSQFGVSFMSLQRSLTSGTDIPDRALGKPSSAFHPEQNSALNSNILLRRSPSLKSLEVRAEHHDCGTNVAQSPMLEHRNKAREFRRDAFLDSGAGLLLSGNAGMVKEAVPASHLPSPVRSLGPGVSRSLLYQQSGTVAPHQDVFSPKFARDAEAWHAGGQEMCVETGGIGAFSGRAIHASKVSSIWAESMPDNRDEILPQGVQMKAAVAGTDPRHMIQRVKLHPSRSVLSEAPFATDAR